MMLFSKVGVLVLCLAMPVFMLFSQQVGAYLSLVYLIEYTSYDIAIAGGADGTLISYAMLFTFLVVSGVIFVLVKWRIANIINTDMDEDSTKSCSVFDYLAIHSFTFSVAMIMIGLWILYLIVSELLTDLLGIKVTDFIAPMYQTAHPKWLLVVVIVLIVPIYEELVFRGILWSALANQFDGPKGVWLASIITSLIFAIIHTQYGLFEISAIFILALILSLARYKSGSLLLPILIHAINNGVAMGLYLWDV